MNGVPFDGGDLVLVIWGLSQPLICFVILYLVHVGTRLDERRMDQEAPRQAVVAPHHIA